MSLWSTASTDMPDSATTSRLTLTSRLLVACIPFALYCFLFSCIPPYVTSTTPQGPSESTSNQDWDGDGWLASGLGRVIVLGVVILGGLSGFGAMRTTWNFLEHIRHGKRCVTCSESSSCHQQIGSRRRHVPGAAVAISCTPGAC